jgi:DnaK suppressor protein
MSTVMQRSTALPAARPRHAAFRLLLEGQRAACLRQREAALAEAATSVPDPVAVRRAADLLATIGEIDAALDRIVDGTYGRCAVCGIGIPVERLEARPHAAGCVTCQTSTR